VGDSASREGGRRFNKSSNRMRVGDHLQKASRIKWGMTPEWIKKEIKPKPSKKRRQAGSKSEGGGVGGGGEGHR